LFTASLALAQVRAPQEPFHLTADLSRFRGADDSSQMVEVHYAVAQGGLTYRADSAGWSAAADVTLLVRSRDSLLFGDRWLVPHALRDTAQGAQTMNLVGVYAVQLPRGEFTIVLMGRDRNGTGRTDSTVFRVTVTPSLTDRLTLSDIEFASSIKQGAASGPFTKNTLEVIPCVGGLYGEDQKAYYYLEAYNLLLGGNASDMRVQTAIYDAVGKELLNRERPKKRSGESAVLVDQFSVNALHSGTYMLVVTLRDTGATPLARSARRFFVFNPTLGIDSTLLAASSGVPMAVYASMEEPELDRECRWTRWEITDPEKQQFDQLKGADAKRKFLSDLWHRRPPGAREQYLARVAEANRTYSTLGREGYRTDRGRVYIIYGPADDYERHPNEQDSRPYEIWSYNNIQGGVIFVFVQRNQGGDYELVHSTHRNELHDENWMRYAQTN
jgi:GWxTD domain-containing protein